MSSPGPGGPPLIISHCCYYYHYYCFICVYCVYVIHIVKYRSKNNILSDKVKINELFDIVINETSLEKEIKFLIIYKKVLFNSDTESENNLIKMIDPLIKSDSIWKSHGLYLMAEYFYSKGEKQKSKEFYEQIINLENSNPKIKIETHKRLNRDFSE